MIKQRISLMLPLFGFRVQYGFILDRVFLHEKKYRNMGWLGISCTLVPLTIPAPEKYTNFTKQSCL